MKESMTITQALTELKTIDKRIVKLINGGEFIAAINTNTDHRKPDDIKKAIEAGYQKVCDLIDRRNAMKMAIVLSNATTKVTINGKAYTVAEAIDAKAHLMAHKRTLLTTLAMQSKAAANNYTRMKTDIESAATKLVNSATGEKMSSDAARETEIYKTYMATNSVEMIDPLGLAELMAKMAEDIDGFETMADTALSVSNATTTITFYYGKLSDAEKAEMGGVYTDAFVPSDAE